MSALQTLMEMGFSENSVKRALAVTGDGGVEQAMEWLLTHADDPGINDPPEEKAGNSVGSERKNMENEAAEGNEKEGQLDGEEKDETEEAKSIKCDDCGKLFKTSEEVEFHAVKSGHSNFSESTEEKKPLTEEEKRQKKMELEDKIRERRKEREQLEEKETWEREKKRIQMGQEIAERKRSQQEQEMKRVAEERKREKIEDRLARQRVKEQIERDKQARKEKFANKGEGGSQTTVSQPKPDPAPTSAPAAQPAQKKEYTTTKLQIRLPNGTPLVQEFKAKESLSAVRLWISLNRQDNLPADAPFKLCTSFPRKTFSDEDMDKPLDVLGLVPSAVLMVTK